jgi:hypothetical protein
VLTRTEGFLRRPLGRDSRRSKCRAGVSPPTLYNLPQSPNGIHVTGREPKPGLSAAV